MKKNTELSVGREYRDIIVNMYDTILSNESDAIDRAAQYLAKYEELDELSHVVRARVNTEYSFITIILLIFYCSLGWSSTQLVKESEFYEGSPLILSVSVVNNTDNAIVYKYPSMIDYPFAWITEFARNSSLVIIDGETVPKNSIPDKWTNRQAESIVLLPNNSVRFQVDLRYLFVFPNKEVNKYRLVLLDSVLDFDILPYPGKLIEGSMVNFVSIVNDFAEVIITENDIGKYELKGRLSNMVFDTMYDFNSKPIGLYVVPDNITYGDQSPYFLDMLYFICFSNEIAIIPGNNMAFSQNSRNMREERCPRLSIEYLSKVSFLGIKHSSQKIKDLTSTYLHCSITTTSNNDSLLIEDKYILITRRTKYCYESSFIEKEEYDRVNAEKLESVNLSETKMRNKGNIPNNAIFESYLPLSEFEKKGYHVTERGVVIPAIGDYNEIIAAQYPNAPSDLSLFNISPKESDWSDPIDGFQHYITIPSLINYSLLDIPVILWVRNSTNTAKTYYWLKYGGPHGEIEVIDSLGINIISADCRKDHMWLSIIFQPYVTKVFYFSALNQGCSKLVRKISRGKYTIKWLGVCKTIEIK